MQSLQFLAVSVTQELDLNQFARHFGIEKKFKWEDILTLKDNQLKGIISDYHNKTVYIFHFGCLVSINCTKHDLSDLYNYLCKIDNSLVKNQDLFKYIDSYRVEINSDKELEVYHNYMVAPKLLEYYPQMIAIVLARSVALDRIEDNIEKVSDDIEKIIEYLDQGNLNIGDNKLAKLSAGVLRYKYNTISYVMVLDKPDITWYKEDAEILFLQLSDLFELQERYEKLRHKTETIMDITEVFTILTHAKRGAKLEWMIIILIAFEIVLSLVEKLF
ncbi:RMD1 family protein [Desulforamulus ferrireducens]|uniref:DUF155 domain-containing protein n=1 Tax=Desulforamulus ferrireducens TaxID=1833852 RepID=A0A1S6ISM1_9FIRM|nr:RMD1 family protein [Desulforamulus ferrireducens]AQS57767.1 hypothetical protein B0537_00720 [Desulforamulus ferrireducens]